MTRSRTAGHLPACRRRAPWPGTSPRPPPRARAPYETSSPIAPLVDGETGATLRPGRAPCRRVGAPELAGDDHVEPARPVHAFDAVELDVRGGRRARDER